MQVVMNLLDGGMDSQAALNAPRICLEPGAASGAVLCEDGLGANVIARLGALGHDARVVTGAARSVFGRGQIILRGADGVLQAGSDPRADGCAMGF
jgi:gamma-glutamyltranspeptidase/glutathione hydrolase